MIHYGWHDRGKRIKYLLTFRRDKEGRGCDQAFINYLIHKKNAQDEVNFLKLSKDLEIVTYLSNTKSISLLWDICCIPDFQGGSRDVEVIAFIGVFGYQRVFSIW